MRISRLLAPILFAGLCACSSAPPSTTPELTQRAKHAVRYDGPEIKAHLEYWCSGPLVFAVADGVQPGRWVLLIDLEGSDVRIPFTLGQ